MTATSLVATVATYDAGTRSGTVLTDAGLRYAFADQALREVRLLRPGQRVRITMDTAQGTTKPPGSAATVATLRIGTATGSTGGR